MKTNAGSTRVNMLEILQDHGPMLTINEEVASLRAQLNEVGTPEDPINTTAEEVDMLRQGLQDRINQVSEIRGMFTRAMQKAEVSTLLSKMIRLFGGEPNFSTLAIPASRDPTARQKVASMIASKVIAKLRESGIRIPMNELGGAANTLVDMLMGRTAPT